MTPRHCTDGADSCLLSDSDACDHGALGNPAADLIDSQRASAVRRRRRRRGRG